MKKPIFILLFFCQLTTLQAQELQRQREVGLVFSSLDRFGFTYRVGHTNSLWRFSSVFGTGGSSSEANSNSKLEYTSNSIGLNAGREYRKPMAENLSFRYGVDFIYQYRTNVQNTDDLSTSNIDRTSDRKEHAFGMGIVLGLNYIVGKHFTIGAEILPSFIYTTGTEIETSSLSNPAFNTTTQISGFNYTISSGSAALSVVYVF